MTIHYVRPDGSYVGGYGDGAMPSEADAHPAKVDDLLCLEDQHPEYADQRWLFPGWSNSQWRLKTAEAAWQEAEILVIGNQLMAIEEAEAGSTEAKPLPGTRAQWLIYRTKVRAWNDANADFLDVAKRPVRPS